MYLSREIYEAAQRLKKECGGDPFEMADYLKIGYFFYDIGSLLGLMTEMNGMKVIVLSPELEHRDRDCKQVMFHEIGHCVFHPLEEGDIVYREMNFDKSRSRTEYEANAFAAHCLLEDEEVLEALKYYGDVYSAAHYLGVNEQLLLIKIKEMIALGHKSLRLDLTPNSNFLSGGKKILAGEDDYGC